MRAPSTASVASPLAAASANDPGPKIMTPRAPGAPRSPSRVTARADPSVPSSIVAVPACSTAVTDRFLKSPSSEMASMDGLSAKGRLDTRLIRARFAFAEAAAPSTTSTFAWENAASWSVDPTVSVAATVAPGTLQVAEPSRANEVTAPCSFASSAWASRGTRGAKPATSTTPMSAPMVPFARRLRACLRENVAAASAMKPAAATAASAMPAALPLSPVGASRLNREDSNRTFSFSSIVSPAANVSASRAVTSPSRASFTPCGSWASSRTLFQVIGVLFATENVTTA